MAETVNTIDKNGRNTPKDKKPVKKKAGKFFAKFEPVFLYYAAITASIILIFLLIRPPSAEDISQFKLNEPSPRIITAPFEFSYIDTAATETKRMEAESLVSPVYNAKPENLESTIKKIQTLSKLIAASPDVEDGSVESWAKTILAEAGIELENRSYEIPETKEKLPKNTYSALYYYRKFDTLWISIINHIQKAKGSGITDIIHPIRHNTETRTNLNNIPLAIGITIIDKDGNSIVSTAISEIRSEEEFFTKFKELVKASFPNQQDHLPLQEFTADLINEIYQGPTLVYNPQLTDKRKKEERDKIVPITVFIYKGQTLIGKNDVVTAPHLQKLKALREHMQLSPLSEAGYLVLGIIFVLILLKYLQSYYVEIFNDTRKIVVILLAIILILGLARVIQYLALLDLGRNTMQQAAYAIPMGMLGVILTILSCARLAAFCCALTTFYMGFILHSGDETNILPYLLVAILTASAAIITVTKIQRRSDLYRAGGVSMLLASITILAIAFQDYKTLEQLQLRTEELKWALIWGAVNGGMVSILSIALMPIFEDFYGITTDIKLLELSQKNELLQRLEEEAPGSYQHSMRVATLAESAAGAIGANSLLAKVGCYYHDIGKIEKPAYFVENQQNSADKAKHSKISPHMSCLIIRNHVKNGLELAKKYKLPKVILDFIPEHHGTTLMAYFYNQALANPELEGKIKEEDFRYPGPKPQCKETAIAMLADCLEAASRTLETGLEKDIKQLVRKIINDRFMDGQFDDCTLTLKDLHTLFISFSDSLIHMMHQRIVYPERPMKEKTEEEDTVEA